MSSSAGAAGPCCRCGRRAHGLCRKSDAIRSCRIQRRHENLSTHANRRDPRNYSPFIGFASGKRSFDHEKSESLERGCGRGAGSPVGDAKLRARSRRTWRWRRGAFWRGGGGPPSGGGGAPLGGGGPPGGGGTFGAGGGGGGGGSCQ